MTHVDKKKGVSWQHFVTFIFATKQNSQNFGDAQISQYTVLSDATISQGLIIKYSLLLNNSLLIIYSLYQVHWGQPLLITTIEQYCDVH